MAAGNPIVRHSMFSSSQVMTVVTPAMLLLHQVEVSCPPPPGGSLDATLVAAHRLYTELGVQVIYHIAQRMVEFHAAGYVHRDLKPGNVMWLPRTNRWTVIDFGCAAHQK
jgi:serine/threonine protein kinase